jgi:hypothetical protein
MIINNNKSNIHNSTTIICLRIATQDLNTHNTHTHHTSLTRVKERLLCFFCARLSCLAAGFLSWGGGGFWLFQGLQSSCGVTCGPTDQDVRWIRAINITRVTRLGWDRVDLLWALPPLGRGWRRARNWTRGPRGRQVGKGLPTSSTFKVAELPQGSSNIPTPSSPIYSATLPPPPLEVRGSRRVAHTAAQRLFLFLVPSLHHGNSLQNTYHAGGSDGTGRSIDTGWMDGPRAVGGVLGGPAR